MCEREYLPPGHIPCAILWTLGNKFVLCSTVLYCTVSYCIVLQEDIVGSRVICVMHFSQSEAANHPSISDSQRLPITQELSQSEDSYHSSISATQAENHLCTSANHAVNHSSTSANQNITHTILHEKPKAQQQSQKLADFE